MVCRDDFSRSSQDSGLDVLSTNEAEENGNDQTQETINIEEENDNTFNWAATEGYSPLADLSNGGEVMFVAYHPGENDEQEEVEGGEGGVFFADMNAFSGSTTTTPDAQPNQAAEESEADRQDFRSLADQALKTLDMEYSSTLQGTPASATSTSKEATTVGPSIEEEESDKIRIDDGDFDANRPFSSVAAAMRSAVEQDKKPPAAKSELPPIDTEAVKKAVDAIRLKAPKLTKNLDKWQQERGLTLAPREHSLIPATPLAAFRKRSPKAIQASANLSRAATLTDALQRLNLLSAQELLTIHIIGADGVECDSERTVKTLFGPFVRWVGASGWSPKTIRISMVGPNVPGSAAQRGPVDLMPANKTSSLEAATASCHTGCYHEWLEPGQHADLCVAFNAGIWGYNEWRPTLEKMCDMSTITPFLVTSYTVEEAEDDYDEVAKVVGNEERCLWKAQSNPFASRMKRETATAVAGRDYRENAAWQCWRLGKTTNLVQAP